MATRRRRRGRARGAANGAGAGAVTVAGGGPANKLVERPSAAGCPPGTSTAHWFFTATAPGVLPRGAEGPWLGSVGSSDLAGIITSWLQAGHELRVPALPRP